MSLHVCFEVSDGGVSPCAPIVLAEVSLDLLLVGKRVRGLDCQCRVGWVEEHSVASTTGG
jgi:hypothetical protein